MGYSANLELFLSRFEAVTSAHTAALGAKTPKKHVRLSLDDGTKVASFPIKSTGSKKT